MRICDVSWETQSRLEDTKAGECQHRSLKLWDAETQNTRGRGKVGAARKETTTFPCAWPELTDGQKRREQERKDGKISAE